MMAKCELPEVSHVGHRAIEPFVQPEVLIWLAAVLFRGRDGVVVGVSHQRSNSRVESRASV
jgi:hypothetical protein